MAIRMEHLIIATARELQKLGKMPSQAIFRNYYDLMRQKCVGYNHRIRGSQQV